eukprot:759302-Hanusia_phi.AAC.2
MLISEQSKQLLTSTHNNTMLSGEWDQHSSPLTSFLRLVLSLAESDPPRKRMVCAFKYLKFTWQSLLTPFDISFSGSDT